MYQLFFVRRPQSQNISVEGKPVSLQETINSLDPEPHTLQNLIGLFHPVPAVFGRQGSSAVLLLLPVQLQTADRRGSAGRVPGQETVVGKVVRPGRTTPVS